MGGEAGLPLDYRLEQNYPNPFNPQTTITFALPRASMVRLTVSDLLGREVGTITEGYRTAGVHQVVFANPRLASGMYFYRLEAGARRFVKKMMLLR